MLRLLLGVALGPDGKRTGTMRKVPGVLMAVMLAARLLVSPPSFAQESYAPPDSQLPLPLSNTRPETGGLFLFGDCLLNAPGFNQPGFRVGAGWRFASGESLQTAWLHQTHTRRRAATAVRPAREVVRRTQEVEATWRLPYYETECWRISALAGPRVTWVNEQARSRSLAKDHSAAEPAEQTRRLSRQKYGAHLGLDNEFYLGHGFAVIFELDASLSWQVTRRSQAGGAAKTNNAVHKQGKSKQSLAPQLRAILSLVWYPLEGVQLKIGYDLAQGQLRVGGCLLW